MRGKVLEAEGLCKRYPGFALKDVSFSVAPGEIMGFIGRNGAGKTTTLKALLGFVCPDAGTRRFFGLDADAHELEIKRRIGFVSGGADFYLTKRLGAVLDVTRRFYPAWDEAACRRYMEQFQLEPNKRIKQLSAGMRVKFALVLALSHGAELLLLDEPTSGLDPVSREELLEIFLELADTGVSILFSTHITSDLEKCAGGITYIRGGRIAASGDLKAFTAAWRLVRVADRAEAARHGALFRGLRRDKDGYTALLPAGAAGAGVPVGRPASLEEIMVHLEKEGETE